MLTINEKSYVPPYAQLKRGLLGRIRRGEFPPGERVPSIRELAQATGLAYQTVAKAITELTDEGVLVTRKGRGTFVAKGTESALSERADALNYAVLLGIGVRFPVDPMTSPFSAEICAAVNRYASEHGVRLTLLSNQADPQAAFIRNAAPLHGIILLNADSNPDAIPRWKATGLPMVMINKPFDGFSGNYVGCHDRQGARAAVRHLLDLGHRRIACLRHHQATRTYRERFAGYLEALSSAGVPADDSLVADCQATISSGHDAAAALLARPDPPTAVFASTDLAGIGAVNAALDRGLRVPTDVSVAGFMDLNLLSNCSLLLTTVRMHIEDIGVTAALVLEELIRGDRQPPVQIELAPTLVVRETTARGPA